MAAIELTARLEADAEARRTRDGEHLLMLRVALPAGPAGRPIVVRACKSFGTGAAADLACKSRSRQMKRGVRVVLAGEAISWQRGTATLSGLSELQTPDLPVPMRGLRDD